MTRTPFLHSFRHALCGAALAGTLTAVPAFAADTPFSNLHGSWSGAGVITTSSGTKERIRCRATYTVGAGERTLNLALRCASEAYNFHLTSNVTHANGAVTGVWNESTYAVGGTVTGRGAPGRIQVRAEGAVVTALLSVNTRDNRQSVSISSPGSPLSDVAISMSKSK